MSSIRTAEPAVMRREMLSVERIPVTFVRSSLTSEEGRQTPCC
jgi:hypothetical protein